MLIKREIGWLNSLQSDLALKRDWVAVGHLQALIDHIAETHGAMLDDASAEGFEPVVN